MYNFSTTQILMMLRSMIASPIRTCAVLLLAAFVLGGCRSSQEAQTAERLQREGWTPLFNGGDLSEWTFRNEAAKEVWRVKNGVIDCEPKALPRVGKHLWSKSSFGDFRLHVEWRITGTKGGKHTMPLLQTDGSPRRDDNGDVINVQRRNADSGLYLRGTQDVQTNIWRWPVGSGEVYRYRTNDDLPSEVRAGVTPSARADKPIGEWNTFVITMRGERLTVELNGETVIDEAQLPGVPAEGPIALQHHGGYNEETGEWSSASSLVQFRNIFVKRLQ
jgi:hypothetical protein